MIGGKVYFRQWGKTLLGDVNKLLKTKTKNARQCFAFTPQGNFPTQNLNFHWRWRWWARIQAIFLNLFYFKQICSWKKYIRTCANSAVHILWSVYITFWEYCIIEFVCNLNLFQALYIYDATFFVRKQKKGKNSKKEEKSKESKISDFFEFITLVLMSLDINKKNAGRVLKEKIAGDVQFLKDSIFD